MLMIRLLFLLFLGLSTLTARAQARLPATWIGDWTGTLRILKANDAVDQLDMELHIHLTDSLHRYDWTILYHPSDTAVDRRAYELIGQRDQDNHFVIDEKNSILLDCYFYQETLSSYFQVDQSLLLINYTYLGGDSMRFEVFPTSTKHPALTGEDTDYTVKSYPIFQVQRATLRRISENDP
jgi:hypothetical protein